MLSACSVWPLFNVAGLRRAVVWVHSWTQLGQCMPLSYMCFMDALRGVPVCFEYGMLRKECVETAGVLLDHLAD